MMGLLEDARNIQRKDPAARTVLEVILLYPGFHILVYHRIAHWLFEHKHFFLARWVSQLLPPPPAPSCKKILIFVLISYHFTVH